MVAPYVGAWIETYIFKRLYAEIQSHPTWVRGLKLSTRKGFQAVQKSHPTWVRGLKLYCYFFKVSNKTVAPYVGAWIETFGYSLEASK